MALLAGAAAAVLAAVPVAVGIMNALKNDSDEKQIRTRPPMPTPHTKTALLSCPAPGQGSPAPRARSAVIVQHYQRRDHFPQRAFWIGNEGKDFYRDPYTQQLYLCTENELPGADTDYDLHPSDLASARNLDVLNGRVKNSLSRGD